MTSTPPKRRGRPAGRIYTEEVRIRMDAPLRDALDAAADAAGRPTSEVAREALRRGLGLVE